MACFVGLVAILAAASACRPGSNPEWQRTVDAMTALRSGLAFPRHLAAEDAVVLESDFDVNRYFDVLHHLKLQPGYRLDYVYHYDGMGGYPLLYARPLDAPRYPNESALQEAMSQAGNSQVSEQYTHYLLVDDSAEGYFEYVVFRVMAAQFYLYWHAAYNDTTLICSKTALEQLLAREMPGEPLSLVVKMRARALNLGPVVTLQDKTALVEVVTFSAWRIFARETWEISRVAPYAVIRREQHIEIPYNCGIMF